MENRPDGTFKREADKHTYTVERRTHPLGGSYMELYTYDWPPHPEPLPFSEPTSLEQAPDTMDGQNHSTDEVATTITTPDWNPVADPIPFPRRRSILFQRAIDGLVTTGLIATSLHGLVNVSLEDTPLRPIIAIGPRIAPKLPDSSA